MGRADRPRALRSVLAAAFILAWVLAAAAEDRSWSWLGVRIRDMSEQEMEEISERHGIREGFGVVVVEVLADTPAARAGMQNGDIVVAVNGRPITETRLLQRLVAAAPRQSDTRVTVLRTEGRRQLSVRLATMPVDIVGDRVAAEFGFVLREAELPADVVGGVPAGTPMVSVVLRGGPAEKAGLQPGDVVLQVAERPVLTREATRQALAQMPLQRPLPLTVRREGRRLDLTLAPPGQP